MQSMDASDAITRWTINKAINGGHAAIFKAIASADPNVINYPLGRGRRPIYEAVRQMQPDVVAVLLDLGADLSYPVEQRSKQHSSLLSMAAAAPGPRMTKMLLRRGVPVAHSGAVHTAARCGRLDTMRLLMEHGADVNEARLDWSNWTPMHFAASRGHVDAMQLLEQSGARSDLKDVEGKTPAQLLEDHNTAKVAELSRRVATLRFTN